jgi:hypothetical protein
MKIPRLGNTEFNLCLAQFCETKLQSMLTEEDIREINNIKICYIDWLYKTGGYYDKNIPQKTLYKPDEDYTHKFIEFINEMINTLKNSDKIRALFPNNTLLKYIPNFETYCNSKIYFENSTVYNVISLLYNKKILVVSSFKELIEQQINNGNLLKIQPLLNNTDFLLYKFPYTFFNNGPHEDSKTTLEYIKNDIKINYTNFDLAILACGCYGSFLVDMISSEMKKDAIYVGGQLPLIFGIIGGRDKWAIKELYNNDITYLINGVPDQYKPLGWEKIEDGCYW